jgi:hypothetical protein
MGDTPTDKDLIIRTRRVSMEKYLKIKGEDILKEGNTE